METMTKRIVQGALWLTVAGLISKVLSAMYRIPLQNLTGDIGFYIYQQVYPLIGTVMILSLYGFPVAISKLTVETMEKGKSLDWKQFYFPLFLVLFCINGIICLLIFFSATSVAEWVGDNRLGAAYQFVALLFLLIPPLALMRGVSQGKERLDETGLSQVLEQIFRVGLIITAAFLISHHKLDIYRIGEAGVFATMIGMIIATLFLILKNRKVFTKQQGKVRKAEIPWRYYFYVCLSFGIIAAITHMILILIQLADVLTLVPNLKEYGLTATEAMKTKGIFDRAQPLIQFGIVFGSSFALALVPTVVREKEQSQLYRSIREAMLLSFYIACGAAIGLIVIFPETNILLFTNANGSGSMRVLVISIIFTAVAITGCVVLQSMGYIKGPAFWITISFFIKWTLNEFLVPAWGLYGSAFATIFSLALLCMMILRMLHKKLPGISLLKQVKWRALFLATIEMTVYLFLMKWVLYSFIEISRENMIYVVPFLVVSGALIYVLLLLRYSALTKQQLEALPFSQVLIRLQNIVEKNRR